MTNEDDQGLEKGNKVRNEKKRCFLDKAQLNKK